MEEKLDNNLKINQEGRLYTRNRAARRRKPPTDIWYTKSTHKIKKIRSKHAKRNQQRKLARARKARKENLAQVS